MKYRPELDGLRCYAVLMVLIAHLPYVVDSSVWNSIKWLGSALRFGYLGVDIFFVLSGFLITRILLESRDRQPSEVIKKFYLKRLLRIFPIFYITVIFCFLFLGVGIGEVLANIFYVSNYYYSFNHDYSPLRHTWSLSVEEQFYLVWPFLILLVPRQHLASVLIWGSLITLLVSSLVFSTLLEDKEYEMLVVRGGFFRMVSLSAGALIALYHERLLNAPTLWPVFLALIVMPIIQGLIRVNDGFGSPVLVLLTFTVWSVTIFLSVLYFGAKSPILKFFMANPVSIYIGRISYGVYLYHMIVIYGMGIRDGYEKGPITMTEVLLAIVVTLIVSALSFRIIETPLLRLKSKISH